MDIRLNKVREHINLYFRENLPQYTVLQIRRKSCHPEDEHLYMVAAKKTDGTFAVWTSWNEAMLSLNHGHYGLMSIEDCKQIFNKFFYTE